MLTPILLGVYDYVDYVGPYGFRDSSERVLNASGESVGNYLPPGAPQYEAFLWSPTGQATTLETPAGGGSTVIAINDSGESVGASSAGVVEWSPSGQATVLDPGPGFAYAINDSGEVAGLDSSGYAAIWSPTGQETILQGPPSGNYGAVAINASGQSVGTEEVGAVAVLWSPTGAATTLQHVGGAGQNYYTEDFPLAITDSGWSVGNERVYGELGNFPMKAILWSPTGKATRLNAPGATRSVVNAINNTEQSVGWARIGSVDEAMLWDPSGHATILRNRTGKNTQANDINDAGQIVGQSGNDAMLWSPTGATTNLARILGQNWHHTDATEINANGDIVGHGLYEGKFSSFLLMNSGAGPDHYTAVDPYTPTVHPTLASELT